MSHKLLWPMRSWNAVGFPHIVCKDSAVLSHPFFLPVSTFNFFCLFAYYFSTLFSFLFVVKFAPKVLPSLFDLRENPFPSLFFLCIWIRGIMVIEELLVSTIRSEINSRDCLLVLGFDLWLMVEMSLHRVITCCWTTCNPYSHFLLIL